MLLLLVVDMDETVEDQLQKVAFSPEYRPLAKEEICLSGQHKENVNRLGIC